MIFYRKLAFLKSLFYSWIREPFSVNHSSSFILFHFTCFNICPLQPLFFLFDMALWKKGGWLFIVHSDLVLPIPHNFFILHTNAHLKRLSVSIQRKDIFIWLSFLTGQRKDWRDPGYIKFKSVRIRREARSLNGNRIEPRDSAQWWPAHGIHCRKFNKLKSV